MRILLSCILSSVILITVVPFIAFAVEGDTLWTRTYGGTGRDGANCIIPSGDGGYLLAGSTNFGMYLLKVDAHGDTMWTRAYGGTQGANCIIPSGDGGFLLAGQIGDQRGLVKVNAQGDILWSHIYPVYGYDPSSGFSSVIPGNGDGFLLAGATSDRWGDFSWGSGNMVEVDEEGLVQLNIYYSVGSGPYTAFNSIVPSGDGDFLLPGWGGYFGTYALLVKVNGQGDVLWSHIYEGSVANSIIPSGDGGFLLAGSACGYDNPCIYLVKVNTEGDSLWSRTYSGGTTANAIISTSDGNFLLAGFTALLQAPYDMCLAKVNLQGDTLWTRAYGGSGYEEARSVIQTADGNYLVAGYTDSYGAGGGDMWLVCVEGPGLPAEERPIYQPISFGLANHPNPFNASTTIVYDLPRAGHISLRVFDLLGREVAVLKDGFVEAGTHRVTFDCSNLPTGIYFARLEAGEFTQTKKLMLLK